MIPKENPGIPRLQVIPITDEMASEKFCLRWNDFHANITAAFSEIKEDEDFLDVTLVSTEQTQMFRVGEIQREGLGPELGVYLFCGGLSSVLWHPDHFSAENDVSLHP